MGFTAWTYFTIIITSYFAGIVTGVLILYRAVKHAPEIEHEPEPVLKEREPELIIDPILGVIIKPEDE